MSEIDEVDHTADWAIRVRAADARELFTAAAHGMFALLADPAAIGREHEIAIDLEAVDLETLLVDWLNELLYRAEVSGMVFPHACIDSLEIGPRPRLRARARGGPTPAASGARRIKAATFAGLRIAPVAGGLEATIVFDV
jgi:SHS2 domain-containing protein